MLVHVTDWYPTLLSAASAEVGHHRSTKLYGTESLDARYDGNGVADIPLDGKDLWNAIQFGATTDDIAYDEREVLLDLNSELNCSFSSCGVIRKGDWKYIRGANMVRNTHLPQFKADSEWQRYAHYVGHEQRSCLFLRVCSCFLRPLCSFHVTLC